MINSPIQNGAKLTWKGWEEIKSREYICQWFGENPDIYKQFGLNGHNGCDYLIPTWTPVYASFDGVVMTGNDPTGYGLHIVQRSKEKQAEAVYAHFQRLTVQNYQEVKQGDLIGYSGATGFSFGNNGKPLPHLHFGYRKLIADNRKSVWDWEIKDYDNGYLGYIDIAKYIICWKGTLTDKSV